MITFPNPKINIGLSIVGRRDDGYHELVTAIVPLFGGWHDILEAVPSQSGRDSLTVSGLPCNCPPESNLVMKAVAALREAGIAVPPLDIYLRKVIPDGAGLGGGSADAAFMLRMGASLADADVDDSFIASLSAKIGSDCPFFIYNRPMLATGTGTTLNPVDIPALSGKAVVVVKPDISVSTAEAYRGVTPAQPLCDLRQTLSVDAPSQWRHSVANDFELSVFPNHPEIAGIKQHLVDLGAEYASMSGSGSAVYGIFGQKPADGVVESTFADCKTMVTTIK